MKESGKFFEAAALFGTGIIAGFTFYVSNIEIPSRKDDTGSYNLASYQHVFPLSAAFMKPFGIFVNALMGGAIYTNPRKTLWWIPFFCIGALGPFTAYSAIAGTNETLMAKKTLDIITPDDDKKVKDLVTQWGKLHDVRTGLSLVGFAVAIAAALDLA
mmetsp:Transcript_13548/g.19995  ORF Transcript_13548/g.19995 Transcript_13548/m.19995 type:complete len:158 (-) Transcript_13548:73-546(-)|eukprot:CAMPEP_0194199372 /NCGR_PEP_ID=MMETSP0156-20130528/417_1 /TAXON_ID=33649 /ORGANISM="Thalassionema nitzschioides, Strain L26-B" /LENGTH=157 /DNA_ID=CAMNT_0038924257 /DNA_START=37 /DNA_END=510 /DNA_ORIENTATION=+